MCLLITKVCNNYLFCKNIMFFCVGMGKIKGLDIAIKTDLIEC